MRQCFPDRQERVRISHACLAVLCVGRGRGNAACFPDVRAGHLTPCGTTGQTMQAFDTAEILHAGVCLQAN